MDKGFNIISYDLTVNATESLKKSDDGNVYITQKIHGRNFHQWSYGKEISGSERKPKSKKQSNQKFLQGTMSQENLKNGKNWALKKLE